MLQLLTPYTDPERHNEQRHRRTDGQTDGSMMPIADRTQLKTVKRKKQTKDTVYESVATV